jgi:hypothetical protein
LTLRPADSLAGLVLTEGIAFGPDAVALSDELVLVGWANASAERPEDLVLHHVPLEDERIDLSYPPRSAVVRPHRAFALASYAFGDDCTPLADVVLPMQAAPETVDAYVEDGYEIIDRTDLALDVPAWALYAGERSGVSCEAAIDEARPQAERDGVGLLVYQDSREIRDSVVAKLRKGDALAPQCYLEHGEPVADFARRVREECDRLAARLPAGVVLMPAVGWHTRKDDAHPDGLPAASLCWAWVALTGLADLGQWFGLIGFREGLADFCEALAPYLEDFDSGIPVLAYPPTPDPPPDPVDPTDPDLPDIDPPAPPFIPEAVALSIEGDIMRGYLRHRVTRKVARVDPAPRPGASGNHQWPVNWDKDDAGGHELGELLKDGDRFVFRFEACGRVLCLNGAGQWETRADAGGDERFLVTDQPEGVTFLYRSPAGAPVELCEFVEAAA